ncbi:MAG: hypothetical protein K2N81_00690 [Acetatifactor sp.]|nr:hypothetical protein [Acetatifactor sp.]
MLGKLIKYEWKSTYKMCGIIIMVIAGVTLVGALGFVLPFNLIKEDFETLEESMMGAFWAMMMMMSMMLYIITLVGAAYAMLIYQGVHFYKTMYTDEGYLTQTLPVTPRQLLFSKTLVAGIWNLLVGLSIGISIMILIFAFISSIAPPEAWRELDEVWREIQREMARDMDAQLSFSIAHAVLSLLLMFIVTPFCTMMTMFGALTIGQLSRKYKALIGILSYFGAMIVQSILMQVLQFVFTFGNVLFQNSIRTENYTNVFGTYDSSIVVALIMGVSMYFVAHHILTKKLNMD